MWHDATICIPTCFTIGVGKRSERPRSAVAFACAAWDADRDFPDVDVAATACSRAHRGRPRGCRPPPGNNGGRFHFDHPRPLPVSDRQMRPVTSGRWNHGPDRQRHCHKTVTPMWVMKAKASDTVSGATGAAQVPDAAEGLRSR
jgi:hypothetical protein